MEDIKWHNLVEPIKLLNTNKTYFGKYLYRVEFKSPGVYWLRYPLEHKLKFNTPKLFEDYIANKQTVVKQQIKINNYGNVSYYGTKALLSVNISFLHDLFQVRCKLDNIRHRIEGERFQIYTETEDQLTKILEILSQYKDTIISVHRPVSDHVKLKLENNVIFIKYPKFNFRVHVKSESYSLTTRKQILNYISNFPDSISVSGKIEKQLNSTKEKEYIRGYYYTNDTENLIFLRLISHQFVGKIFRLESSNE
jgi:hypothetical protein